MRPTIQKACLLILITTVFFLFLESSLTAKSFLPPSNQIIKCTVTRDTWISSVNEEKDGSNGGSKKLKLKGQQEYTLLDIDTSALKGKLISGALLHIHSESPEKAPLARIGISAISSEWTEGTSTNYSPQTGSSCFSQAEYKKRDWTYPGSTLMDVVFGYGNTIWKFANVTSPDTEGWQICAVDPDVVAARIANLSYGFCLYDEVGSTWSVKNASFLYEHFPNRFVSSRESFNSTPCIEIRVAGSDSVPPEPVTNIHAENMVLPPGEAFVKWDTPKDRGGGKTLGFQVSYKKGNAEISIPRYLIPMAGKPGQEVRMHIHNLPFQSGENIDLSIRPVDNAGNIGQAFSQTIQLSKGFEQAAVPPDAPEPFPPSEELPGVGEVKISVTDLVDKTDPENGKMIPDHPIGYKGGNHIFSAKEKTVRLQCARNETICFQLNLEGPARNISLKYSFDPYPALKSKVYQIANVKIADKNKMISILPDPLIPLEEENGTWKITASEQANQSLLCEVYIPHEESAGKKNGSLSISVGDQSLELKVDLTVWNFTLPDKLSFIPEMNAYGTVSPFQGYEYYRLAHEHRTCINRLPCGWNGKPAFAPEWRGNNFDWSQWDQKVSPLLDGTAFDDLPRKKEPVDVFYLPFSENWPVNLFAHYTPSYWADEAFAPQYSEELKKSFALFAAHCNEKKWHDTIFQFYLNNKVYYREKYPQSSAPWIFDEPVNTQDFWALRWYGILWHTALSRVKGNAQLWYRGDISYSQFGRNILWGIMDVTYIGANNAQKTRMKKEENMLWAKTCFAEYGTANKIEESNLQPVLWCLSAWSKGATGVLPWQTIGSKNAWENAEQTALFYPHPKGPMPSVRLKAFARGQQDVEYLMLFCDVFQLPQPVMAGWLKYTIDLNETIHKNSENDAGTLAFDKGDTIALWKFRYRLGKMLSAQAPPYKRSLADRTMPKRDMDNLPDIGYVRNAPQVESCKPVCETFTPVSK